MSSHTHFEITRTDDGYTARLVSNGRTILSSGGQVYARRSGARNAIRVVAAAFSADSRAEFAGDWITIASGSGERLAVPVREVDERGGS